MWWWWLWKQTVVVGGGGGGGGGGGVDGRGNVGDVGCGSRNGGGCV